MVTLDFNLEEQTVVELKENCGYYRVLRGVPMDGKLTLTKYHLENKYVAIEGQDLNNKYVMAVFNGTQTIIPTDMLDYVPESVISLAIFNLQRASR